MNIGAMFLGLVLLVFLFVLQELGILQVAFDKDLFHIMKFMICVFGSGVVLSWFNKWQTVGWLANSLLVLGLIGTVMGLIYSTGSMEDVTITQSNLAQVVSSLLIGVGIALYTTLIGAVGYLWLHFITLLCGRYKDAGD